MDEWLARMAMQVEVKGRLTVILARWPKDEPVWRRYFPEFRRAGGELRMKTVDEDLPCRGLQWRRNRPR